MNRTYVSIEERKLLFWESLTLIYLIDDFNISESFSFLKKEFIFGETDLFLHFCKKYFREIKMRQMNNEIETKIKNSIDI